MKWLLIIAGCVLLYVAIFYPFVYKLLWSLPKIIIFRIRHKEKELHLFGIFGYVGNGNFGCGKTLSAVREANRLRRKYGDKIFITSNFGLMCEDMPFRTYDDICTFRDNLGKIKPVVVFWDEIQNDFPSDDWMNFPRPLLSELMQCRKEKGLYFVYTCPTYGDINKRIRTHTFKITECRIFLKCFTVNAVYSKKNYEDKDKREGGIPMSWQAYVHSDSLYNSYETIKRLK